LLELGLPGNVLDTNFDALEISLNVKSIAEDCNDWDENHNHCVYTYRDITQLDEPIVYVGIGKKNRPKQHWTKSHNDLLNEYIEFWKLSNVEFEDVCTILFTGIKQRQAAVLETLIVDTYSPECNLIRYWTPLGASQLTEYELLKIRAFSNPVLAKDYNGALRLFISAKSAAKALGILRNSILEKIGKTERGYSRLGYSFRYLTESEIEANIKLWPVYYQLVQDQKKILSINLDKTLKDLQISRHELDICFKHTEHKKPSLISKISYEIIHNHDKEELFDFKVTDDLNTPKHGKGYTYVKGKNRFLIQIRIKGKNNIIGTTPTEEIAKKVANFVYDNEKDENVIINAKKLCAKLKDENGELRRRVPAGYYSNPDNIKKELIRIKPKSLSDWQKKNDNSYVWAWKLGIQRELFDEYLSKSEITQGN
jgi:hypothetical protein